MFFRFIAGYWFTIIILNHLPNHNCQHNRHEIVLTIKLAIQCINRKTTIFMCGLLTQSTLRLFVYLYEILSPRDVTTRRDMSHK